MSVEYCVVSIGTLSHNRLWGESVPVRTAHATTTYIESGKKRILVDPSLPEVALAARFTERTGKRLGDVTDVLCTTLRPVHRRSIEAFEKANWWASDVELKSYGAHLDTLLQSADRLSDEDAALAKADLKLLERFQPAPDKFTDQVCLFPTPGPSAGATGLLLTPAETTVAVAGDAAVTIGHVTRGQIWQGCSDTHEAMGSLTELLEIADIIVTGHDNVMVTPRQRWF
jgi:glyoxylase-like metal-dependent hydrolase (beta-lactamase superfamily II)